MAGFVSEQGLSDFETAGIVDYCEDLKRAKTPLWVKRYRFWMGYLILGSVPPGTQSGV